MATRFKLHGEPSAEAQDALRTYDPLTQRLLAARGIVDEATASKFFARDYESGRHDPFLMSDMDRAVERVLRAIAENERITIYSDYDCDGIPGGALMHDFFRVLGYANFTNYIPHRHDEGYGLNLEAVERIREEGTKLLITVDCGITDNREVARAMELGMDVIVTDHHEPGLELPPAYAVLNPKRKDNIYPFSGLCGTGVAFKLIEAILARGDFRIAPGQEKWFLDVVGLATIADMVPLVDENRLFAHYGLLVMRKGRRLGLRHLMRTMRMDPKSLVEDDIGFMIGPRINAASRMDSPEDAFKLLVADNDGDAGAYARHLDRINNERKGVVGAMVKDIKARLAKRSVETPVIVAGDPSWRPALVGLAANTLAEEHARPVFIWGRDGRGLIKGSCRSGGDVSVVELMRAAHDVFHEYGGHHASGGFSVKDEHVHAFPQALCDAYGKLDVGARRDDAVMVDASLALEDVTPALVRTLSALAPFGEGNRKPLFLFHGVAPERVETFGKTGDHTKLRFKTPKNSLNAIAFFKRTEDFQVPITGGTPVDLIAHVEESTFGGRREIRLRVVEVLPSGGCETF